MNWYMVENMLIGVAIGFLIGFQGCKWVFKYEAADEGHAEFYLDKNRRRQWRWKK